MHPTTIFDLELPVCGPFRGRLVDDHSERPSIPLQSIVFGPLQTTHVFRGLYRYLTTFFPAADRKLSREIFTGSEKHNNDYTLRKPPCTC